MKALQVPQQLFGMNRQRCGQGHLSESAYLSMKRLHGFSLLDTDPIDLKSKNISLEAASATSDISFVKANLGSSKMEDIARKDSVGPGSTCK